MPGQQRIIGRNPCQFSFCDRKRTFQTCQFLTQTNCLLLPSLQSSRGRGSGTVCRGKRMIPLLTDLCDFGLPADYPRTEGLNFLKVGALMDTF